MEWRLIACSLLDRFNKSPPQFPEATSSTTTSSTPTATSTPPAVINTSDTSKPKSASSSKSSDLSTGAQVGIGIGASALGLALIAGLVFFLLRHKKQKQIRGMLDSGSTSVGTPEKGMFYGKRGTIQTQEDTRSGLHNTVGMGEYQPSTAHGENNYGTTTSVSGPNIPPRSPNRALRGGSDNYF